MLTRYHGETPRLQTAGPDVGALSLKRTFSTVAIVDEAPGRPFGYMFPDLAADPAARLPEGSGTVAALRELGRAMGEDSSSEEGMIPAAYTYFGQFIDHDITKTVFDPSIGQFNGLDIIEVPNFAPLSDAQVAQLVTNSRSAQLDLDSLYEGVALEATGADGSMLLGQVETAPFGSIATADRGHDLPRRPRIQNPTTVDEQIRDREALIGDPRNDENLIVGQLHLAFLRAHNALLSSTGDAEAARRELRRRYQWAVLHDFLRRIGERDTVDDVLANGARFLTPASLDDLFMPLEFSGAAYRFGHSMIRQEYEYNSTFNSGANIQATFNFMFTFTALSGDLSPGAGPGGSDTLPDNWIIEWHRFFGAEESDPSQNPARRIDTHIAPELGRLPDFVGRPIPTLMGQLAARNLLRGYLLALPSGQAVAARIGAEPLTAAEVLSVVPGGAREIVRDAALADRTPLWFYVLAEAELRHDGHHLGAVGTRIIAETLWNLVAMAKDSVVADPPSQDELSTGEFTLRGIIRLGQDRGLPPI